MNIRNLALTDVANLLNFEFENRAWFEQHMTARPATFFSTEAVQDHIQRYLAAQVLGRFHACVVVNNGGQIIARANLRNMDIKQGTAEVGYRVAQRYSGLGIASFATQHVLHLAYSQWQLTQIHGFVGVDNAASARVLEKNGFIKIRHHLQLAKLQHGDVDCIEYIHVRTN